jgi:iron(II)-dependent oxidoreductase
VLFHVLAVVALVAGQAEQTLLENRVLLVPQGNGEAQGNVAEWVADWYDPKYYATAPGRNPTGPGKGTQKGFRGGGWIDSTPAVRAAQRNGAEPNVKMNWLGFRCAKSGTDGGGKTEDPQAQGQPAS